MAPYSRGVAKALPIEVVIVSYRCRELLRECLGSIAASGSAFARVHVVDNASGDGTVEMLARDFPRVRVHALAENTGFARANNVALRGVTAPAVLVLNPDARLRTDSIEPLVARLEARPEVGIVGPRLELEDGADDHAAKRSFPTPLSALGHFSGVGRGRGSGRLAAYRAPEIEAGPVDAINGAFMLIRTEALRDVGLFDERYWMYMEDLDLCFRFARSGWTTWYEPSATAIHMKGGTTEGGRGPRLQAAFHSGMDRFYRDHYAPGRNPLVNVVVRAGIAAKLAVSLASRAVTAQAKHGSRDT
ncbi:MAG: glycosyltransferase family 2 protein [Solirubrobacterales bacterium]